MTRVILSNISKDLRLARRGANLGRYIENNDIRLVFILMEENYKHVCLKVVDYPHTLVF